MANMQDTGWTAERPQTTPVKQRDFCLLQNVQTGSGAQPASYSVGTGDNARHENGRDVKFTVHRHLWLTLRGSRLYFLSPTRLHGVQKDNSAFTFQLCLSSISTSFVFCRPTFRISHRCHACYVYISHRRPLIHRNNDNRWDVQSGKLLTRSVQIFPTSKFQYLSDKAGNSTFKPHQFSISINGLFNT